ncbi:MAG TPA: c-type cytochrome [Solirubrobacteraceae bacterium]|nr:c-type cytochrome [Solirubrobacteraceae bacterium]
MTRRRAAISAVSLLAAAAGVTACGKQEVELTAKRGDNASMQRGAELFAARCSGCHTMEAAAAEGSSTSKKYNERTDGPNFDQRREQLQQVLYAIRNGGFSGAIMPQNIVVGRDAVDVARFVAAYSGSKVSRPQGPTRPPGETGG